MFSSSFDNFVTAFLAILILWQFCTVKHVASDVQSDINCSNVFTRWECQRQRRYCEWRHQGVLPGLFRCEHRDSLSNLYLTPYDRIGNSQLHQKKSIEKTDNIPSKCASRIISDLGNDECYSKSWRNLDECGCMTEFERTYVIPRYRDRFVLTPDLLANKTMFVFIHANKAAGETIKNIGYGALTDHNWDGAGYATKSGWQFLEQTLWPKGRRWLYRPNIYGGPVVPRSATPLKWTPLTDVNRGRMMYSSCGVKYSTFDDVADYVLEDGFSLSQARECPLRFIWGNSGMGLCDHFPGMPCVYFLALRDPLSRALSDYNYFCLDGAEGKKKWTPEMVKAGECNIGPLQWFKSMHTSPFFFVERLTRGCSKDCGPEAAIANLFHPCVRYILVESFTDGLRRLKDTFYPAFSSAIDAYLKTPKRMNRRGHGSTRASLKTREFSNSTLDILREYLAEDYKIYNEAVRRYNEQWTRPLESCNALNL